MFVTWRKFRKKDSMNSGIQILTLSLQCFFLIWWEVIWGPSHVSFRSHHLNLWSGRLCLSLSKMVSLFHFNGAGWKWRDEDADTFYTELRLLPNMTRLPWDAKVRGSCEMLYSDRGEVGCGTFRTLSEWIFTFILYDQINPVQLRIFKIRLDLKNQQIKIWH